MATEIPRHEAYACEERHPGQTHNDWIAQMTRNLEELGSTKDMSDEAVFIGKIQVPQADVDIDCDHNGTPLIRMDGVPKHDEGYACGRCGTRFVQMNSAGRFHRAQLVFVGNNEQTDEYARIIPSKLLLDGLEIKGVTNMRFEANLKGDARKIWVQMIVRSFDEIVVPKEEAPSATAPQGDHAGAPQGAGGGLDRAEEGDGPVREARPRRRAPEGASRAGKSAGGA